MSAKADPEVEVVNICRAPMGWDAADKLIDEYISDGKVVSSYPEEDDVIVLVLQEWRDDFVRSLITAGYDIVEGV